MQDQTFANHPKHLSHVAADLRKLVLMKLYLFIGADLSYIIMFAVKVLQLQSKVQ